MEKTLCPLNKKGFNISKEASQIFVLKDLSSFLCILLKKGEVLLLLLRIKIYEVDLNLVAVNRV